MFNMTKTAMLMAAITALFVYVAGALGEHQGMLMAHELEHIKNDYILLSTIAVTMAGAISSLANLAMISRNRNREGGLYPLNFLLIFLAPLVASLIQMTISRVREYESDLLGSQISEDPLALAPALKKIESTVIGIPFDQVETHLAIAQMMIMNPLSGGGLKGLFSTQPSNDESVNKLVQMSQTGTYPT